MYAVGFPRPARFFYFIIPALFYSSFSSGSGFITDASLKGSIDYWQRQRDRKETDPASPHHGQYQQNLHHATFNGSLDFSSGFHDDVIGLDLAAFSALELSNSGPAAPNEIGFSAAKTRWNERWSGDRSGISLYKAAIKLKYDDIWLRAGYLQPGGQTLIAPHWSFLPGTYVGAESGYQRDRGESGILSFSYMWTNRYKAPWYTNTYNFRKADDVTAIPYLHSLGIKYDFKNKLIVEGAFGQAAGYMNQYFAKVSYDFPVSAHALRTSWQFYGAQDKQRGGEGNPDDVYAGLAWLQALTLGYSVGPFDLRLEGTWVKAEGNQGYFLQRMTPGYASSNGRLDVWWDARSDWNANGEKALFAGVTYDLAGSYQALCWARHMPTAGMLNPAAIRSMTSVRVCESRHGASIYFIRFRRDRRKRPYSNCITPGTTITAAYPATLAATPIFSRMSKTSSLLSSHLLLCFEHERGKVTGGFMR